MNESIEKVLAVLDGYRMCDEITYSAYSALHDEISMLDDLLRDQEKRIRELEEKLRLLEFGNQDTSQSLMAPAV